MIKVAFVGPPDSGKTTLAKSVSSYFNIEKYNVAYIDEYAREFITKTHSYPSSVSEQFFVFEQQRKKEYIPCNILFTDSPTFLAYVYAIRLCDYTSAKDRLILSKLYEEVLKEVKRYDLVLFLETFREPVKDGVRDGHIDAIDVINNQILSFLTLHGIQYELIPAAALQDRVNTTIKVIKERCFHE
jgi:nicotinamide riboside kinase